MNVARLVSDHWREMSAEEREIWEERARLDKARYMAEKSQYQGPWKVPANKRKPKDPTSPKKPVPAYFAFSNARRQMVKSQNPTASNAEISKILARMWKEAPLEVKKAYQEEEALRRAEHGAAMQEWKKEADRQKEEETNMTVRPSDSQHNVANFGARKTEQDFQPNISNDGNSDGNKNRNGNGNGNQQSLESHAISSESSSNSNNWISNVGNQDIANTIQSLFQSQQGLLPAGTQTQLPGFQPFQPSQPQGLDSVESYPVVNQPSFLDQLIGILTLLNGNPTAAAALLPSANPVAAMSLANANLDLAGLLQYLAMPNSVQLSNSGQFAGSQHLAILAMLLLLLQQQQQQSQQSATVASTTTIISSTLLQSLLGTQHLGTQTGQAALFNQATAGIQLLDLLNLTQPVELLSRILESVTNSNSNNDNNDRLEAGGESVNNNDHSNSSRQGQQSLDYLLRLLNQLSNQQQ